MDLKSNTGFTRVELEVNKFELKFNSSKLLNSLRSSGRVTRLLPYKSRVLSLFKP